VTEVVEAVALAEALGEEEVLEGDEEEAEEGVKEAMVEVEEEEEEEDVVEKKTNRDGFQ